MAEFEDLTEYNHMINEEPYDVNDPKLVHDRLIARRIYDKMNRANFEDQETLDKLTDELFGSHGKNCGIRPSFICDYGYNIHVGDNFFANFDCILLDTCDITIGDNCLLAPRVQLYTAAHPLDQTERLNWIGYGKKITIGNNCWIGGGSAVMPGVTLGNNVVVGGGSVVTKSFGDNVVIAGNPAHVIKQNEPK